MQLPVIDPLVAAGVVVATALTDACYVMFTAAVAARRRWPAATWSSVWYLLSSFAVISYTSNWAYVLFAAAGSFDRRLRLAQPDAPARAEGLAHPFTAPAVRPATM